MYKITKIVVVWSMINSLIFAMEAPETHKLESVLISRVVNNRDNILSGIVVSPQGEIKESYIFLPGKTEFNIVLKKIGQNYDTLVTFDKELDNDELAQLAQKLINLIPDLGIKESIKILKEENNAITSAYTPSGNTKHLELIIKKTGQIEPTKLSIPSEEQIGEKKISNLKYGAYSSQGRRNNMEDAHLIKVPAITNQENTALFAVFDGHGEGGQVARFCAENLPSILENISATGEEKLKQALIELNTKVKGYWTKGIGGTCAIVAYFEGNNIYIANIGDSRAVLSRDGKAVALSEDQKPTRPDEKARIEKAGGNILGDRLYGPLGNLAVSRAIGDYGFEQSGLTAEPEMKHIIINPLDKFLILACDGIFETNIDRQKAVDIVTQALSEGNSAQEAAKKLVQAAYNGGSRDNLSVIVIIL